MRKTSSMMSLHSCEDFFMKFLYFELFVKFFCESLPATLTLLAFIWRKLDLKNRRHFVETIIKIAYDSRLAKLLMNCKFATIAVDLILTHVAHILHTTTQYASRRSVHEAATLQHCAEQVISPVVSLSFTYIELPPDCK